MTFLATYRRWIIWTFVVLLFWWWWSPSRLRDDIPLFKTTKRTFAVDVRTVGELESSKSTVITSAVKGDQGKIIHLVPDGITVKEGDILIKMDPAPFEERLEVLRSKLKEQDSYVAALEQGLAWELSQAERDNSSALFEEEAAELELAKIQNGDGPLEVSRLKSVMQKAMTKYQETVGYSEDVLALHDDGFLNPAELKQAQKRLEEDKEAYEVAKLQYDSYVEHVFPMQVKKAEVALKQAKMRRIETNKMRGYAIGKAKVELQQMREALKDLAIQLRQAERELELAEIKAPAPGMVVHREEFRGGQRRKPQLGDLLVKNQPILDLPDLESMVVKSKVREVDLCKIGIGTKASIEVDAYPNLIFSGTVSSIGVLALPDPSRPSEEKYFEVRVALDKSDPVLRPGMTTRMAIHGGRVEDSVTVPLHAIVTDHRKNYCYVARRWGYEKREVELGMCNEELAEVKSGLAEGEGVCLVMPTDS